MRVFLFASALAAILALAAYADRSASIGQLGNNSDETGKRSSASFDQIGASAVEAGGLAEQIDPDTVSDRLDIDESKVGEVLPTHLSGDCELSPPEQAILEYLKEEGRVFEDNCAVLAWLDDNPLDRTSQRDLFNVIFGPEAERKKQAELERQEAERAKAEEQARLIEEALREEMGQ